MRRRREISPGVVQGEFYATLADGRVRCEVCPRQCTLQEGQRAYCFVRQAQQGAVVLTSYGRSSGFCMDPIEKKPLNHFFPGSAVLSFGTAGCNLGCKFCQNWDISKARETAKSAEEAYPDDIAAAAQEAGCVSVAFTYNDPVVFHEYAIDTAQACHDRGIKAVAVSAGYAAAASRRAFYEHIDAANIDLKGFTERFYHKLCAGHLDPVLDTLRYLHQETDVWLEVTTLLIPGENDSPDEVARLSDWLLTHLGPSVPLHFTAFHPDYKMNNVVVTPAATLAMAQACALQTGLRYVYTGNIRDAARQSTYCHACHALLIGRDGYHLSTWHVVNSACGTCGAPLPGRLAEPPGHWGARRQPLHVRSALR